MDYPVDSILASHSIGLLPGKFLRAKKPRRPDTPTATQNVAEILVILDPAAQIFVQILSPPGVQTPIRMNLDRFPLFDDSYHRRTHGLLSGISSTKKLVISCFRWFPPPPPWFSDTRRLIQVSHFKVIPGFPTWNIAWCISIPCIDGWVIFHNSMILFFWLVHNSIMIDNLIVTFHCIPLHMMVLVSS